MKRILKIVLMLIIFASSLNSIVTATDVDVNIYQENIFEFEEDKLTISSETKLKLNTNLEINEEDIVWSISDSKIANLTNGKVQPLNNGKVVVTAEYLPLNLKTTCTIDVKFVVGVPTLKVSANTYNSIKITYSKQSNATHYEIQRATKKRW